jgi:protein NrfD
VKFFRFNAGLAAILLVVALAFVIRAEPVPPGVGSVSVSLAWRVSVLALVVSTAAAIVYWATIGRMLAAVRPALVTTAVVAGLIAIAAQALSASSGPIVNVLVLASFVSSAALLGTTCTAMILGHWYLIVPSMQVSHLQSLVKLHITSLMLRIAVVAGAVWFAIATSGFRHYITSVAGIFFWQRVLFGLAGPAVLSYLTWETAKIRSTQSATGILYVDLFTVVVGEVLAKYILLATRVPV